MTPQQLTPPYDRCIEEGLASLLLGQSLPVRDIIVVVEETWYDFH
jgi:hypothetical protein